VWGWCSPLRWVAEETMISLLTPNMNKINRVLAQNINLNEDKNLTNSWYPDNTRDNGNMSAIYIDIHNKC